MSEDIIQVPETLQTASMHSSHSPEPDARPKPLRDYRRHRMPSASDTDSIDTDIVPPWKGKAPTQRPPVPDLRFEQSYLASIRGADTWGRVAWITTRDQV